LLNAKLKQIQFDKIKHIGVSQYLLHEDWRVDNVTADNAQNVHLQCEHKHAVADATVNGQRDDAMMALQVF